MIKTTKIVLCDRCGKEIKSGRSNHGFHIFRNKYSIKNVHDDEYLDLCQGCYDRLAEWMKGADE